MQTILGSTGQIGTELAKALRAEFTTEVRLVSRSPHQVHEDDQRVSANLLDAQQTMNAVAGSEVAYFTAGLPLNTKLWEQQFPVMVGNVVEACAAHGVKLVFFDNTYMYPQTSAPQVEGIKFQPNGRKGRVRAQLAKMVDEAIADHRIEAMICRAPEFYGPGKTQSITNNTVLDKVKAGQPARVFLRDDTQRTLIYSPDASRAMALLGNTPDAYGQTWHLPCDDARPTYRQMIQALEHILERHVAYKLLKKWQLMLAGLVRPILRETWELLPRYADDHTFVSDKFKQRFPHFSVTPYREGLEKTLND